MARRGMTRCRWLDLRTILIAMENGPERGSRYDDIQNTVIGWGRSKIDGHLQELEILGFVTAVKYGWKRTSKVFGREPEGGFGVPAKPKKFGPAIR